MERTPSTERPNDVSIPEADLAYSPWDHDSTDDDEREAAELSVVPHPDLPAHPTDTLPRSCRAVTSGKPALRWYGRVKKFWKDAVRISVPHVDCRNHLANERTYLSYLRTSLALSMMGIVIAQLYRLQHVPNPNPVFGYFVLGKPLAVIFQCSAFGLALLGSVRFWKQQHAMSISKVYVGGWEIMLICGFVFVLIVATFVVHVAIDIYKTDG